MNRKKQCLLAGLAVVIVLLLALGVIFARQRLAYYRSPAYLFRNADGCSYLNIAHYGAGGITALAGKNVKELDLSGGGLTDLDGLSQIKVETLILTDNKDLTDYQEILNCQGLRRLVISQDMVESISQFPHDGVKVVVEK